MFIHHVLGEKKPGIPRFERHRDTGGENLNATEDFYEESKGKNITKDADSNVGKDGKLDQLQRLKKKVQGFTDTLRDIKKNVSNQLGYDPFTQKLKKFRIKNGPTSGDNNKSFNI
jgi:hypothetical protein